MARSGLGGTSPAGAAYAFPASPQSLSSLNPKADARAEEADLRCDAKKVARQRSRKGEDHGNREIQEDI
jgi:hypothetical protein